MAIVDAKQSGKRRGQAERDAGRHGHLAPDGHLEQCWPEPVVWEKRMPMLPPLPDR